MNIAEPERRLAPVLNYDPASVDEAVAAECMAVFVSPVRACQAWLGSVA
jgi:hypothetical protein